MMSPESVDAGRLVSAVVKTDRRKMFLEFSRKHSLPQCHLNQNLFDSWFGCRIREKGNGHARFGEENWENN